MKIAIRYYTKSKKGNTEKIAKHIEKKINVPALGHRMGILGCSTAEMKMSLIC